MLHLELQIKDLEGSGRLLPKFEGNENAGLDLFAAEDTTIEPGCFNTIKLGVATAFAPMYVGLFRDRSSMAGKGLHVMGGVIDSSYRGEWKVMLHNINNSDYEIKFGDKIIQVIFVMCNHLRTKVVTSLPDSLRGVGGFGSTGK